MAYKPDQGRMARMTGFWLLVAFWAFGCYRLHFVLQGWFASWFPEGWHPGLRDGMLYHLPVVGGVNLARLVALAIFGAGTLGLHRILNRPKVADMLVETEAELRKVTWPTPRETYTASLVVVATVVIMIGYLYVVDLGLLYLAGQAMGLTARR